MLSSLYKTSAFRMTRVSCHLRRYSSLFEARTGSLSETRDILQNKTEIKAQIKSINALGAAVDIILDDDIDYNSPHNDVKTQQEFNKPILNGLINMKELKLYREILLKQNDDTSNNKNNIYIGDILKAYVHRVRDDGQIDVGLRPNGRLRTINSKEILLSTLLKTENGILPLGDRSDIKLVKKYFPGMSKSQFKKAVSTLFREGYIIPSKHLISLIPENERIIKTNMKNNNGGEEAGDSIQFLSKKKGEKIVHNSFESNHHPQSPRILKKSVPYGIGIDSVYITKISYRTKEKQLIRFIEKIVPSAKVVDVIDFIGTDGRPSGRAIVKLALRSMITKQQPTKKEKETIKKEKNMKPMEEVPESVEIVQSVDSGTEYEKMTVKQLKEVLKSHNLRVSGLKADLINRLKTDLPKPTPIEDLEKEKEQITQEYASDDNDANSDSDSDSEFDYDDDYDSEFDSDDYDDYDYDDDDDYDDDYDDDNYDDDRRRKTTKKNKDKNVSSIDTSKHKRVEDVVSEVCSRLNMAELNGKVMFMRPFFPPRSSFSSSPENHQFGSHSSDMPFSRTSRLYPNIITPAHSNHHQESLEESELESESESDQGETKKKKEGKFVIDDSFLFRPDPTAPPIARSPPPPPPPPAISTSKRGSIPEPSIVSHVGSEYMDLITNHDNSDNSEDSMKTKPSPKCNDYRLARKAGQLKRGKGEEGRKDRKQKANRYSCVFFGNLPYNLPQSEFAEQIEDVVGSGSVIEMRFSPYGDYCHVDFETHAQAEIAVHKFNRFEVNHRPLKVDFAIDRSKH